MSTNDPTGTTGALRANGSSSPDVAALQADIERTRADLAHTVDRLTARLDMKARVRDRLIEAKDDPTVLGLGALVAAAAVVAVVLVRRSSAPRRTRRRR